jgi:hypothetical protein
MSKKGAAIDYRLRPGKHIERRMIARALSRLSHFDRLENYQYVGLGALYFADFKLFHELGVEKMTSIEKEKPIERYRENRPYKTVDVEPGTSSTVLPMLTLNDRRSIIWLDYTDLLDADKLEDIRWVADRVPSGSALLVTVTVRPEDEFEKLATSFIQRIGGREALPKGDVPTNFQLTTSERVGEWVRLVINQRIEATLNERNRGENFDDCYRYFQLFNFRYADGAPMLTVGGVIYQNRDDKKRRRAEFDSLPFVKNADEPYVIPTPLLTHREMMALDSQLPAPAGTVSVPGVPAKDIEAYADVYRYFPRFVDADF